MNVRVERTIKANEWSTICLPFAMSTEQVREAFGSDVELADFTGYEATEDADGNVVGITVNFDDVTAIEANHPYIIKVSENISSITVHGVSIEPEEEPTDATIKRTKKQWSEFIGTYVAGTSVPEECLFISDNQFWYSTGATTMKAFRAYFDFYDVLTEAENQMPSNSRIVMSIRKPETTGVTNRYGVSKSDDRYYNLNGLRIEVPSRGIYVKGEKKIVVK